MHDQAHVRQSRGYCVAVSAEAVVLDLPKHIAQEELGFYKAAWSDGYEGRRHCQEQDRNLILGSRTATVPSADQKRQEENPARVLGADYRPQGHGRGHQAASVAAGAQQQPQEEGRELHQDRIRRDPAGVVGELPGGAKRGCRPESSQGVHGLAARQKDPQHCQAGQSQEDLSLALNETRGAHPVLEILGGDRDSLNLLSHSSLVTDLHFPPGDF